MAATIFTASACSSNSVTTFSSNWYRNAGNNNVLSGETERLTYSVGLKESPDYSQTFTANYTNGTYETVLSAVKGEAEDKLVYSLTTSLKITVEFFYRGESKGKYEDKVTSEVLFEGAPTLRPISSNKTVLSHSPYSATPAADQLFNLYDYSVDTTYSYSDGAEGKSIYVNKTTGKSKESTFSIPDKYSYLDNEQLLFGFRGVSFTSSHQLERNNATSGGTNVQVVKATPGSLTSGEFNFERINGSSNKTIEYYPVEIALAEKNPGITQTVWYAATDGFRNVPLRMEVPIYYGIAGTLIYELKKAKFTKQ